MAGLSPAEIAMPIRSTLGSQKNARVLLGEAVSADLKAKFLHLADGESIPFDYLVIAAGACTTYFGHDEWERYSLGMKSIDDAVDVRRHILLAFEGAERELDEKAQERLLTFAVIGGGPTGVEVAGTLAELSKTILARDFRRIGKHIPKIVLIEMGDRVLPAFSHKLSASAARELEDMGITLRLSTRVTRIDERGVELDGKELVESASVIWAAGVKPCALASSLGVELDKQGRIIVASDCSLTEYPNVFAIGDIAHTKDGEGKPLPGLAPVAMQAGRAVKANIERDLKKLDRKPFHYVDKGMMATIGRSRAIVQYGKLRLTGFIAWMMWIAVHIWYLIGFRNRVAVMLQWAWLYITFRRGARLITGLPDGALKRTPSLFVQSHDDHRHEPQDHRSV
jgi:NADH dehydrogenase